MENSNSAIITLNSLLNSSKSLKIKRFEGRIQENEKILLFNFAIIKQISVK